MVQNLGIFLGLLDNHLSPRERDVLSNPLAQSTLFFPVLYY